MSEEKKLTTNRIEAVLLEKKQNEFREELEAVIENLDKVLRKYCSHISSDDFKVFKSWFAENAIKLVPPFGGSAINSNLIPCYYPECLNKALLKNAVDEFIKSFEQVKKEFEAIYGSLDC